MPLDFAKPLLIRTTACSERICCLQHYSQVVPAYITLQAICSLTVTITGLPRAHSDVVAYQDVKKASVYYCEKCNVGLRAVCLN